MVFYNCSCNFRNLEILAQSKESSSMVLDITEYFIFPYSACMSNQKILY